MAVRNKSPYEKAVPLPFETKVQTPDGPGITKGMSQRKHSSGGAGTRQYKVQLQDGRIRHYKMSDVHEIPKVPVDGG